MPEQFADIAFPTAVRRVFTYQIPDELSVEPGMRVWVPLRREKVIGMVVHVHSDRPSFKTRPLLQVLDEKPVMTSEILKLTQWIHRFYFCSWGEVIQAALPVGLNFVSEKRVMVSKPGRHRAGKEGDILKEIPAGEGLSLSEARRRWREDGYGQCLDRMIQKGILEIREQPKQRVERKKVKHWDWSPSVDPEQIHRLSQKKGKLKWVKALEQLLDCTLPQPHSRLIDRYESLSNYALRKAEAEGWIISRNLPVSEDEPLGLSQVDYQPEQIRTLSAHQQEVLDEITPSIEQEIYGSFLLYGVTGSGKTEIYIHALKKTLELGRGGIVLVPEISLTPQTVRRFYQIFGDEIAVLHSRLNDRERYETWKALQSGEKRTVIGPRSAVFAPVKNLGIIIVDEEHDASYKQFDPAPRYHARDVAIMRAGLEQSVVVMGSATPSTTTLEGVRKKKHTLLQLQERPAGKLPGVQVLDMKQYTSAMQGPLTVELYKAVGEALEKNEQVILLYNRRGYASFLQCETCGHIPQSPHCSVSLTYHKSRGILLCHYSGYARKADTCCEACGSRQMTSVGSGTEQLESEIGKLFPEARLLRMDRDTTSGKYDHQRIYETFLKGKADILIGTQLVSKGLDFPNVTLVGVLNAETELAFPSYRSSERMYQLLSQVAGRAGRGSRAGKVYVQTWLPDHRAIHYAKNHDFWSFAREELTERRSLGYPPSSRMIVFRFRGTSSDKTEEIATVFTEVVQRVLTSSEILGPAPSIIEKMHGHYQWETHVKISSGLNTSGIEHRLEMIFDRFDQNKPAGAATVRVTVDVDALG